MISVVVAAQEGEADPGACLESLLGQEGLEPESMEVVLVDGRTQHGGRSAIADDRIRVFTPSSGSSLPRLQEIGIGESRGELVALTESHATFRPDWVRTIQAVHEATGAAVIGGSVTAGELHGSLDWALYLVDYAAFVMPFTAQETDDLPGCNIVFERRVLPGAAELVETGFWKTFFCRQLTREGERLWLDPRVECTYNRHKNLRDWMRRRWVHGRCFGGMRARNLKFGRRLMIAILAPLLPPVLLLRMWRRLWPKQAVRRRLVATLIPAFLAHVLWVAGEWVGNLAGAGDSCQEV